MAVDLKLKYDSDLKAGDLGTTAAAGDFDGEDGLESAVFISLFTDKRARDDQELPDPQSDDRRGYYGDQISPVETGDEEGSWIWLYWERAKTTEGVMELIRQAAEESLQWMIKDKVAVKIECEAERIGVPGNDWLQLIVRVYKRDGDVETFEYDNRWAAQFE